MNLRPYQQHALDGIFQAWREHDSALVVMPTGTGKTVVFSHVIKNRPPGRAMLVAHREELIWQGASKIEAVTGEKPDIEMAEFEAGSGELIRSDIVVSSIQTQNAGADGLGRMIRFDPFEFSLLIIDEAQHTVATTYRKVIDYYRQNPALKVLGVTATPDRADEEALGQVFQSVAYDYELLDAIRDGWLVPIKQRMVTVVGLDLSSVRTTAGDLNGADLSRVMEFEENLHAVASPTLELTAGRKTLVFAASIEQAERLAEIFNRHTKGCARFVCGKTPKEERRQMLGDYALGRFQFLVNVGVATEGFDDPGIMVIVMARPTKSRALYAQMAGRGTRPLPGLVDDPSLCEGRESDEAAAARRWVIQNSDKPFVEIIDFVGNCGRHRLMTTADILGGNYSDDVVDRAKAFVAASQEPQDMAMALDAAAAEIQAEKEAARREAELAAERARRAGLRIKARYSSQVIEPMEVLQVEPWVERGWNKGRLPTEKQLAALEKFGIPPHQVKTFTQAHQLMETMIARRQANGCTFKQAKLLSRYGYDSNVSFDQAKTIIDVLAASGWRRPDASTPQANTTPPTRPIKVY